MAVGAPMYRGLPVHYGEGMMKKRHLHAQMKVSLLNNPEAERQGQLLLKTAYLLYVCVDLELGLAAFIAHVANLPEHRPRGPGPVMHTTD